MNHLNHLENNPVAKINISILPVPSDVGSDNIGMDIAPNYLLKFGLKEALENAGFEVNILPEVPATKKKLWGNGVQYKDTFGAISKIVTNTNQIVKQEIQAGNKILALGGDQVISIGTIAGAAEALHGDLGVVWIDVHGDMNTHETSLSGNVHGMASAILLGFGDDRLTNLVKTKIKKENILYIGLKDLDQPEIDLIRQQKLSVITMFDILKMGFPAIIKSVQALQKRVNNMWVSIDVDAIDEQYAPASAMATSGGLTYREITNLLTYIGKTSNVLGVDIVELTPKKDLNGKTAKLCIELAASAFGSKYNWYSEYMNAYTKK